MREIDLDSFKSLRESGAAPILFDVRNPDEYAAGHVPGAVLVPLPQLAERMDTFEAHKGETIYLICQSGGRSGRAAQYLSSQGYDVVNILGGTGGWIRNGWPVDRP
jgi:rhodanese-related sulfurtransferase